MSRHGFLRPSLHPLRGLLAALLCLPLLGAVACAPTEEEPASDTTAEEPVAEPNRLESAELGYVVVDPAGGLFAPVDGDAGEIRLHYAGDENFSEGTVVYGAEPVQDAGVNLVEAVKAREAELELMPDGEFLGQVELGSENLGTAYSTRGRYTNEAGEETEELKIYAVHPTENRLIHMTYTYLPAPGQTQARLMDQALTAFGYIEPMEGAGEMGEGEGGMAGGSGAAGGEGAAGGSGDTGAADEAEDDGDDA